MTAARPTVTMRVDAGRLAAIDAAAERAGQTRTDYLLGCEERCRLGRPSAARPAPVDRGQVEPRFKTK